MIAGLYATLEVSPQGTGYRVHGILDNAEDAYDLLMAKWVARLRTDPHFPIAAYGIWRFDVLRGFVCPVLTFDKDAGEHWHEEARRTGG